MAHKVSDIGQECLCYQAGKTANCSHKIVVNLLILKCLSAKITGGEVRREFAPAARKPRPRGRRCPEPSPAGSPRTEVLSGNDQAVIRSR